MTHSFVNIISTYSDNKLNRTLDYLQNIYGVKNQMKLYFKKLIDNSGFIDAINEKKVLLKPNWVKHSTSFSDDICLCTHPNFILALVEVLLEWKPKSILIADAPVQGCDWSKLLSNDFINTIDRLSEESGVAITIKDFRRSSFSPEMNKLETNKKPLDDYIIFDVGKDSYLEDITSDKNLFIFPSCKF